MSSNTQEGLVWVKNTVLHSVSDWCLFPAASWPILPRRRNQFVSILCFQVISKIRIDLPSHFSTGLYWAWCQALPSWALLMIFVASALLSGLSSSGLTPQEALRCLLSWPEKERYSLQFTHLGKATQLRELARCRPCSKFMLVSRILAEFSTAKSLWRVLRALVLLFLADRSCSTYLNPSHKVSTESKRLSAKPPTACTKTVRDNTTRSCTRLIKGTAHGTCTEPAHGTFL